mgnify:CR=1 FL=1
MIAPVPIEEQLKNSPLISQVCMVGDGRKYIAALITLSESLAAEMRKKNAGAVDGEVIKDPGVISDVRSYVDQLNSSLAGYERIKYFTANVKSLPNNPHAPQRQQVYIRALRTLPTLEIIYGHFLSHKVRMPSVRQGC